ncbi:PKD domain-containing protein [Roseimarinus sediminis]|uniref:PKD domain-containing protein n=1 Tax=Roseimarinus sediminis TaxID=1610899 RepID=UPI003D19A39C
MKNILKTGIAVLLSLFVMFACEPMENDEYELGPTPTAEQLSFEKSGDGNILQFTNTSSVSGVAIWDLGNGSKGKGESVEAQYPFAGNYTVTMTLYTSGGSAQITQELVIAEDDMALLNTPGYTALTGGADNLEGKTWVFDQYHDGHFGVGPFDAATPSWWSAPAEAKTGSSLYTQEFTFTQVGVKLEWTNNGYVYTNGPGKDALGGEFIENPGGVGDFDVAYQTNDSYNFTLNEVDNTLTLSDGAFFGFYTGSSTFEILSLTETELYVKCVSVVEPGNGWWFRLIPKELNVKPVEEIVLKAQPLLEDFEGANSVTFNFEDMGANTSHSWSNPAPFGINTSSKVFLYEKSSAFYSNIFYVADGYKFDLSEVNKIRVKVFIPSYNDYETVNDVAGEWISINQLKPQLAVKLQNTAKGGSAWETQTEIIHGNLEMDKWLDLEFDFSNVADREDYDKIVIQFGQEGHTGTGIFFFDDFSFDK